MIGDGFVYFGGDGGGGYKPSSVNAYGVATFPRRGRLPSPAFGHLSQRERQVRKCVAMEQCVNLAPPMGELAGR
jgi:hypothetical protein